jgi:hypothetical protein
MTLSESIIVFNLWAMVKTVQSLNSVLMVLWIKSSVSKSTAAVASSKTSTFVFLNNALLRQINCLCPTDRFSPPSVTSWYKPAVKPVETRSFDYRNFETDADSPFTNDFKWACSKAIHTSSSLCLSNGSKFIRSDPENRTASCGIIVSRERNVCRPKLDIFTPSIRISPSAASIILQN